MKRFSVLLLSFVLLFSCFFVNSVKADFVSPTATISFQKTWLDNNPAVRPDLYIRLRLIGETEEHIFGPESIILTNGQTSYSWENVPLKENENSYYILFVDEYAEGYYELSRYRVGNTIYVENKPIQYKNIKISTEWINAPEDGHNHWNYLSYQLYGTVGGELVYSETLDYAGEDLYFNNVPMQTDYGSNINYEVKVGEIIHGQFIEQELTDYDSTYSIDAQGNFTFHHRYLRETININARK